MTRCEASGYAIPLHPACELNIIVSLILYVGNYMLRALEILFNGYTVLAMKPSPHPLSLSPAHLSPAAWRLWLPGKVVSDQPPLTRADSQLVSSASWPHRTWTASLWAPSVLPASACCAISLFFPDARSHRESPWQEIEVFCAVKNHRRPCFEFFTPTSVQRCWSHSRLPDSRAGQLMRVLLDLDLWRGHPWSTVTDSLCQGLGKWEVTIISIGTEEDLFVLNVKKVFTKLTRNINKNWRGSLLLLMCLIC